MPLRIFECPICKRTKRTLKGTVPACRVHDLTPMKEVIEAPTGKMMERHDPINGKSRMKDQMKILKERSRNYARDFEADDLIQANRNNGIQQSGFLKKDGKRRGKIDDK